MVHHPRPFHLDFEFSLEGVRNAWEAHALIMTEAGVDTAEVHNVEYLGDTPNYWPNLRVTFQCLETAKAYTAVYLGLGTKWSVEVDDEVGEYIASGQFTD